MAKGQASIDYLVSYGWAILALVIIVGILLGSGVLSADFIISEECNFGSNTPCTAALYNEAGVSETKLSISIYNAFPYPINITKISIKAQSGAQSEFDFGSFQTTNIKSGDNIIVDGYFSGNQIADSNAKRFVGNISYVSCAPELGEGCQGSEHTLSGRIIARLIPQ